MSFFHFRGTAFFLLDLGVGLAYRMSHITLNVPQGRFGWIFFWSLLDLVEDNSEEKPFVAILSMPIHNMPRLLG